MRRTAPLCAVTMGAMAPILVAMGAVVLILSVSAVFPPLVAAQSSEAGWDHEAGEPVTLGRQFDVPSAVLGEDRPITVGLPMFYDSTAAYPVIYALDGLGHFFHTWSSADLLARNGRMPRAIVVSVANTSGNRSLNMTPPLTEPLPDAGPSGGAPDLLAFIRDELRPWVDARYATHPYDVLIGHSFGGLFVAHVLNTDPEAFDAYIAISPSLWWDEERYVESMDDVFERFPEAQGALYVTMGEERGPMLAGTLHLTEILERGAPPGFRWKWAHMPAESHNSVPGRSTYDGLEWIFEDFNPAGLFAELRERGPEVLPRIRRHYAELSEAMGMELPFPADRVSDMVFALTELERTDEAVALGAALVAEAPDAPMAHLGNALALQKACRVEEARDAYAEGIRRAEEAGSEGLADFARSELATFDAELAAGTVCRE